MEYIIDTENPQRLKETILSCVEKGEDMSGNSILTWNIRTNNNNEKLLVHTTQAWDKVGCLGIIPDTDKKQCKIKFYYWTSYPDNERTQQEKFYLYGRFTELLLVHFCQLFSNVSIKV